MRGILLESFYGGSHKKWADNIISNSSHDIELLTLSASHWKWRMHGAAITFSDNLSTYSSELDFMVVTDMLDLAVFKGLLPAKFKHLPIFLYMHENQLNYPWSNTDVDTDNGRDVHYAFINYTSMLAADRICFNSQYHHDAWFKELPSFLKIFPDHKNIVHTNLLMEKSSVLPIGIDFSKFEFTEKQENEFPVILWNHRWEYDKNPELFFDTLKVIKSQGIKFGLIVLGERSKSSPKIFEIAKTHFENELIHWGYSENEKEYYSLLRKADILPVTSNQDFFGISTVEAIALSCIPLLPNRLAFPEHIPKELANSHLYDNDQDFKQKLIKLISNHQKPNPILGEFLKSKYNMKLVIQQFDEEITQLK